MSLEQKIVGNSNDITMGVFSRHKQKIKKLGLTAFTAAAIGASSSYAMAENQPRHAVHEAIHYSQEVQNQLDNYRIAPFLAETMFASVPHAKEIINYVNSSQVNSSRFAFMMNFSDDNTLARDPSEDVSFFFEHRISPEDYQNPATLLLLKLGFDKIGTPNAYDRAVTISRTNQIQKNPITNHFSRALMKSEENKDLHFLSALYLAVNGDETNALPILNDGYSDIHEVRRIVQEWENSNKNPFEEGSKYNDLLGYMIPSISKQNAENPELAGLILTTYIDWKFDKNYDFARTLSIVHNSSNSIADYRIETETGYKNPFDIAY